MPATHGMRAKPSDHNTGHAKLAEQATFSVRRHVLARWAGAQTRPPTAVSSQYSARCFPPHFVAHV